MKALISGGYTGMDYTPHVKQHWQAPPASPLWGPPLFVVVVAGWVASGGEV